MIAKIIQNQNMPGTYIVSKYNDSKLKHFQIIHQNQKLEFSIIFRFPWWWQPFFSSKVALQLESQGSLL